MKAALRSGRLNNKNDICYTDIIDSVKLQAGELEELRNKKYKTNE